MKVVHQGSLIRRSRTRWLPNLLSASCIGRASGASAVGVMGRGRRSVELTPEFCERLLSMDPDEAVAELQDQGLSQAEARDVVLQLRQEAGVTAELANTLLGLPPHEAVELLMQTPGIQEGGMTAD